MIKVIIIAKQFIELLFTILVSIIFTIGNAIIEYCKINNGVFIENISDIINLDTKILILDSVFISFLIFGIINFIKNYSNRHNDNEFRVRPALFVMIMIVGIVFVLIKNIFLYNNTLIGVSIGFSVIFCIIIFVFSISLNLAKNYKIKSDDNEVA